MGQRYLEFNTGFISSLLIIHYTEDSDTLYLIWRRKEIW